MAYDHRTRKITLDKNSDFLSDAGLFFVNSLRDSATKKNCPQSFHDDWKVLSEWLVCSSGCLSAADEEKITNGWRAYLTIGLAPSFKLEEVFDSARCMYKSGGFDIDKHKAPPEVMGVFDRMLATDEEISLKREYDIEVEKLGFKYALGVQNKKKKKSLSRSSRIFVVVCISWWVWVVLRTNAGFEFLGIYMERWDDDMFYQNTLIPPVLYWVVHKVYSWIKSAKR